MKKIKDISAKIKKKSSHERKYISYEDVPLTDYRDSDPLPQNLTKKFLKIFIIIFLGVVTVFALVNLDKLTPENISHWFQYDLLGKTEGSGYPIRYIGTSINTENFSLMDRSPVYCSDTSIVVLNSNAGEYQNNQHSFANPILKTDKEYSIIYNADATGYRIINRDSTVFSGSADRKLFDADIAENGTYALLTYGNDYLSTLTVNDRNNNKIYGYSFAEYYVSCVSVNSSGTRAALSGISAKDGGLISVIYILDFNQKTYYQKYEFEDSYIYDICYLDNDKVVAVGDNSVYHIDIDNKKMTEISYNSQTLTTFTLKRNFGVLISLSTNPDGRECNIVAINSEGKKAAEIETGKRILSLDYKNEKVCALYPNEIGIYNKDGKQITTLTSNADSRKICFCDSETLYVLGISNLYKLNIEYPED